jgi:hypothetical protein
MWGTCIRPQFRKTNCIQSNETVVRIEFETITVRTMYLHTIIVALWYLAAGIVTNLHLISRYSEQIVFLYSNFGRPELRSNNFRPSAPSTTPQSSSESKNHLWSSGLQSKKLLYSLHLDRKFPQHGPTRTRPVRGVVKPAARSPPKRKQTKTADSTIVGQ